MKTKILIFVLIVFVLSGCNSNKTVNYVCDFSDNYPDFSKSIIEIELTYKDENLLYETNIQKFYFFDSSSEYTKEFLTRNYESFDDGCYKVDVEVMDDRLEIKTVVDYENLSTDYLDIFTNIDGKVLIGDSIEYLEANNCVKQ